MDVAEGLERRIIWIYEGIFHKIRLDAECLYVILGYILRLQQKKARLSVLYGILYAIKKCSTSTLSKDLRGGW